MQYRDTTIYWYTAHPYPNVYTSDTRATKYIY